MLVCEKLSCVCVCFFFWFTESVKVLESLPDKILKASEVVSASDCRQLVIFLMENESDTFTVPKAFMSEVKRQVSLQCEVHHFSYCRCL